MARKFAKPLDLLASRDVRYRGCIAVYNPMRDEYIVKREGHYMGTAKTPEAARAIIDTLY